MSLVFAASALVLGLAVFLAARSALKQQMTARIETETAYMREEFRAGGLDRLLTIVRSRGRGPIALDYLLQDRERRAPCRRDADCRCTAARLDGREGA